MGGGYPGAVTLKNVWSGANVVSYVSKCHRPISNVSRASALVVVAGTVAPATVGMALGVVADV